MALPSLGPRRALRTLLVLGATLGLVAGSIVPVAAAKPTTAGSRSTHAIHALGTARITGSAATAGDSGPLEGEARPDPEESASDGDHEKFIHNPVSTAHVSSAHIPRPAPQRVVDASGSSFDGLNHFDNRFAGSGEFANTQFSLEPPDQGLCVSNDYVLETVNTVVRVRDKSGADLTGVEPLNAFFDLSPEIIRTNAPDYVYGEFTSDPKCYYDPDTDRWFLTILELDVDASSGNFTGDTSVMLAVSQSGDPTGDWNLYTIDTTNDGDLGNCPCLGDQPLIGADANGFYITTNVFPLFAPGFNGAMVYAMSKSVLAAGGNPTVVSFFQPTLAEGQAYSVQPATTPPGAAYATENNGTEYFLSALEFTGTIDNRIALWSMTNTASLDDASPDVSMSYAVLDSEVYGVPPTVVQRDGPTPLRDLLKIKSLAASLGVKQSSEHLNLLNSNDDRMNQTVYADGVIWGALNTVIKGQTGPTRSGIAWFAVTPDAGSSSAAGSVTGQGYVAVDNNDVMFPAVAANADGDVLVGFSLAGPDYYPSAAYAWLDQSTGTGNVNVAYWGVGPADGFTGYPSLDPQDGGVERWGDYSAAVADAAGTIWFATETINQSCALSEFVSDTTCGGTRSILANWGTTITPIAP